MADSKKGKVFGAAPRPMFKRTKRHVRPKIYTGPGAQARAEQYAQKRNRTSKTYRYKVSKFSTGMFDRGYVVTTEKK
jgi:hypothetical protein